MYYILQLSGNQNQMGQKGSKVNDFEREREKKTKTNKEEDDDIIFDVAILGAGMSGVSCAR